MKTLGSHDPGLITNIAIVVFYGIMSSTISCLGCLQRGQLEQGELVSVLHP